MHRPQNFKKSLVATYRGTPNIQFKVLLNYLYPQIHFEPSGGGLLEEYYPFVQTPLSSEFQLKNTQACPALESSSFLSFCSTGAYECGNLLPLDPHGNIDMQALQVSVSVIIKFL